MTLDNSAVQTEKDEEVTSAYGTINETASVFTSEGDRLRIISAQR